jgi:PAS domain-containing protein
MNQAQITSWRILMVDDDEEDYLIVKLLLNKAQGRSVSLDWAPTYEAGKRCIGTNGYDAVLVDYDLGGPLTGIELIREIAGSGYAAPLILYTGRGSFALDLEAQQAGATLYLTKNEANPLLIERSIRYAIERKQIEAQLLASQMAAINERNILQSVMESLPIGVAIVDEKGGNIQANATYESVWGGSFPKADTVNDYVAYKAWWVESGLPVEPEEWASAMAVMMGETVRGQFLKIERFDGSCAFVVNSAAPIFDAQGTVVGSSVAIMDVTQLVETEQAFLKSKEDYQLLNYSMLDGFALHEMIFDSEGKPIDYRFLEVNPAFEALTGLKASDILGRTVLEVLPETEQFWIETYGNVVLSRSSVRFEHYHQTLDKAFEVVAFSPRPNQFAVIFTECRFQDENQLH